MTNLKDLLADFQKTTIELALNQFTQEEEYELLIDELIQTIKERLIGECIHDDKERRQI